MVSKESCNFALLNKKGSVMSKNKKRTNYVQEMINEVNAYLRFRKVKSASDTLFVFATSYLLKKKMYEGYNFYKDMTMPDGETIVPILAGSCKEDEFEYLQIN